VSLRRAEERCAVVVAEQEAEAVQVLAQLAGAVGGVAGEVFQRCAKAGGVTGQPAAEELQQLSELGGIAASSLTSSGTGHAPLFGAPGA